MTTILLLDEDEWKRKSDFGTPRRDTLSATFNWQQTATSVYNLMLLSVPVIPWDFLLNAEAHLALLMDNVTDNAFPGKYEALSKIFNIFQISPPASKF